MLYLFTHKSIHISCAKCAKCQIFGTFATPNTKMKLYQMFQIPKIIQHRYSTVSNMRRYRQMLQKILLFYILFSLSSFFIFSFLFSLTLRFPLSSPCTGSLSLRPVRDVHRQRRRRSFEDDSVLHHTRSHPRSSNLG